jgi:enoyl-CoA hydratase
MVDLTDTSRLVLTERHDDHTLIITLNRPEARNAISAALANAIDAVLSEFEADDTLWTAILTHAGPTFSAGADLKDVANGIHEMVLADSGFAGIARRRRRKPLIAAVDGQALGGGLEICLACDLVVASDASQFGLPEVKRSLLAAAGGLVRLPRLIPPTVAMEMVLTGSPIRAQRAYELGLVNRITQGNALAAALTLAREINANAPLAVRASRSLVTVGPDMNEDEAWQAVSSEMEVIRSSEDFKEGPRAFVEKRPPAWSGR